MKRLIIPIILISFLVSCGAKKVHKEETVSKLKEKEVVFKTEEIKICANNDIVENMYYLSHNFQADSIVVTKGGTKYYNPRSKKEELSQEKKQNKQYFSSGVKAEMLDLEKEFYKSSKTKDVVKEQVNYFKMIFQFWPLLLFVVVVIIIKYKSSILGFIKKSSSK
ncbi:hypothetical protein [Flavobacterium sp. NKUCC04_CG]|uniref:hypothetical protein n=1 Tax=Flavobacterium sp. NKUCC04_CG TaxID=2842121 RepID=UPI001C5A8CDE|nr:hypothetical protein [Flavobacterium sp. NKUCC04_CG]MBW3520417.1 hypothetical protein [Flavobacterium sp. NKUCC04_CG]